MQTTNSHHHTTTATLINQYPATTTAPRRHCTTTTQTINEINPLKNHPNQPRPHAGPHYKSPQQSTTPTQARSPPLHHHDPNNQRHKPRPDRRHCTTTTQTINYTNPLQNHPKQPRPHARPHYKSPQQSTTPTQARSPPWPNRSTRSC